MINKRFTDVHAPGQNVVGRPLRLAQMPAVQYTIAGVVGNLTEDGHGSSATPYVYTCDPAGSWPDPEYVVRTTNARALQADLRRIVRQLDPSRAVFGMRPLQDAIDASLERPRLDAAMLALFAASAVALAAVGLYSLFMLVVAERAREMAVRLALGAAPNQIAALITTAAGRLLFGGIAVGLGLAIAAGQVLRGALFGVSALDAPSLAVAAATLAIAAAASIAIPAARAARMAPLDALRE
jgi:predicted lysophospholipase L1 biosynthesis ABC-type transport system permease subunit